MRKFLITLTIFVLIVSLLGTGIIVYIETTHPTTNSTVSSEAL